MQLVNVFLSSLALVTIANAVEAEVQPLVVRVNAATATTIDGTCAALGNKTASITDTQAVPSWSSNGVGPVEVCAKFSNGAKLLPCAKPQLKFQLNILVGTSLTPIVVEKTKDFVNTPVGGAGPDTVYFACHLFDVSSIVDKFVPLVLAPTKIENVRLTGSVLPIDMAGQCQIAAHMRFTQIMFPTALVDPVVFTAADGAPDKRGFAYPYSVIRSDTAKCSSENPCLTQFKSDKVMKTDVYKCQLVTAAKCVPFSDSTVGPYFLVESANEPTCDVHMIIGQGGIEEDCTQVTITARDGGKIDSGSSFQLSALLVSTFFAFFF